MTEYVKLWLDTYLLTVWGHKEVTSYTVFRFVGVL